LYTARNYDILVLQHENAYSVRFILEIWNWNISK